MSLSFFCAIPDETDHTYSACDFPNNRMQLYTKCMVEEAYIVDNTVDNNRITANISYTTIQFKSNDKQNVSIFFQLFLLIFRVCALIGI